MDELPGWLQTFNATQPANQLMAKDWNTLLPLSAYTHGTTDNVPWEFTGANESSPVFPHKTSIDTIMELIKGTPYGNTLTAMMAKEVIRNEAMGKDGITDFLCISFSSTDYVGHDYGPHSVETEDTYIRLDKDLADLLAFLDREVGDQKYMVFLTSDHGVAPVPGYMESLQIPSGLLSSALLSAEMEAVLDAQIGTSDWIRYYTNQQLYLNQAALQEHDTDAEDIATIHDTQPHTEYNTDMDDYYDDNDFYHYDDNDLQWRSDQDAWEDAQADAWDGEDWNDDEEDDGRDDEW